MNTIVHFLPYLAHLFLEWEIFQAKFSQIIKTHIMCPVTLIWKSYRLLHNVEKYCGAGQATDDDIIRCMRIACWIPRLQTHTHREYIITSHCSYGCTNAPHRDVILTLAVLLKINRATRYDTVRYDTIRYDTISHII